MPLEVCNMSRYLTRLRVKRSYKWKSRPISVDRRLNTQFYESLIIQVEGKPVDTVVTLGQYILIEGDDDDNPYVAQLLKLFSDADGTVKKAKVQWYIRYCEVPHNKRKLLSRSAHAQEVFYYNHSSCDSEVDAETILGTVEVKHIPGELPFPDASQDTLFVKLTWDTKAFKLFDPDLMKPLQNATSPPSKQMLQSPVQMSPTLTPPVTPKARGTTPRALPTPDPVVMKRASSATSQTPYKRGCMSTGRRNSREAESIHSASKLSASKLLSGKRRGRIASEPAIRKKLELSSPGKKMTRDDVLGELLDDDLAQELTTSPPRALKLTIRLTPLGIKQPSSRDEEEEDDDDFSLQPLSQSPEKPTPTAVDEQDLASLGVCPLEDSADEGVTALPTPLRRRATPRRGSLRRQSRTPSQRKSSSDLLREPSLSVLAEEEHEDSPVQTAATPRSRRKCAQLVSSRIRKQLGVEERDVVRLDSEDGDDGDDDAFVPSKIDLNSSSDEEVDAKVESDDEVVIVRKTRRLTGSRTPQATEKTRSSTRTPRKTPSKKTAPTTPRTPRTPKTPRHATPVIPSRSQPAKTPGNVLEEARARLHVSSVPESLPCREQEFQDIYNFVESKVIDGTGGCMYISGVPGTGKTATVHEAIRSLQQAADLDEIPQFRFIEINGMKMTDPHQAYVQILQKLTNQKVTPDHAASLLEKRFSNPAPKKETTVLLVDELDLLWTRKQNVMYNLFDWPTRRHARLVVLTIANTMDLPERIMINRVASRLGLTRMSFQPYTFKQLQQIIASRLNRVRAFEEDALQLVSRKVAALSGDARRCLDICRRSTEICEFSANPKSGTGLVGMSHVMQALDEMFSSAYITAIRCASVQEQLFLRAVIAEFRRLGLEEATFQQVFVQHQALCRVEGLPPVSVSESQAVCQRLGACRLLLLEPSRLDLLLRVRLNVSQDDVLYALKAD
ncbi:origin recognition complex subunit 1 isoform X2 [Sardina pilchardus]|uniref:origin recognition complex subunit 1 isoform X2 n=1 Tax=Sardina pilchardus TaxID=27697 RepID=UPI002E0FC0EF